MYILFNVLINTSKHATDTASPAYTSEKNHMLKAWLKKKMLYVY
jgi:hypothetical protein